MSDALAALECRVVQQIQPGAIGWLSAKSTASFAAMAIHCCITTPRIGAWPRQINWRAVCRFVVLLGLRQIY
ncbi:hypothetical protein [Methylomonas koyamae]|uniref:hypothetical protein n=1 Tax=Methylomonas koyamae TaxID=702114 RepID=UPI00278C2777|nr:hypothetical protein [Methylomonas koyamae]